MKNLIQSFKQKDYNFPKDLTGYTINQKYVYDSNSSMILVPRKESLQCVSTLSEKYWKYKGFYDFPTKWDSKEKEFNKKKRNLRYIKEEFETLTYQR